MNRTPRQHASRFRFKIAGLLLLALGLAACSSTGLHDELIRPEPTFAKPPATTGPLAELADKVAARGAPGNSGFMLLDPSYESLLWRLALIDSAVSSVDIMTYLWYGDHSGLLLLERAVHAANRGVHVRLVVDDLLTIGQDEFMADLENHPNVELRLYNPWRKRSLGSRAGEMIAEMERLNVRMHDKLQIVDGRAAILGGRNIGDHYFGLSEAYNFHDLDVLGVGPVAEQANEMFDHFWNSDPVVSALNLNTEADPERAKETWERIQANTQEAPELERFPRSVKDWSAELAELADELHYGPSRVVYDTVAGGEVQQEMGAGLFSFLDKANEELLITNAYVIPGDAAIDFLKSLRDRGVDVRILTNSLSSHDVPAVNAHYEKWRKKLIKAGVDLYEFRSDPAIADLVNVEPMEAKFTGLHTKAVVIDDHLSFIGSMNFDPRSANINTEMGVIVDSPELAADLKAVMLRDMDGANAWHLTLDEDGDVLWTNSDETRDSQPSRSFMQNVMNTIFKLAPKDLY
jgi:putative cardiolipin synthase